MSERERVDTKEGGRERLRERYRKVRTTLNRRDERAKASSLIIVEG